MSGIPVLLVTANVGSIFEEPGLMLKTWTEEFLSTISRLDPKFIALHCQEVGGKNYEQSMRHVENFVRLLMSSEELRLFDRVTVFLDEDFSSAEHFTALGNFYFVHESLKDVLIWDFQAYKFVVVSGKEVHSGNIESVPTKEKAKFPQNFFPECKWSRKGFLRTRWSISGTPVYLRILITSNAGMINCCLSCPHLCFQVPKHYLELLSMLPGYCSNYSNLKYTDDYSSPKLLHALMIEHDPYTPDSMDSPSPSAFLTSMEPDTQDYEQKNNNSKKKSSNEKTFKMAVSPTLLKTKLEFIRNEQKAQRKENSINNIKFRFNSWPKTYQYKHHCKMKNTEATAIFHGKH
ncbi:hypothetical protein G9C98_000673 [Cotesia typhae]|uniref:Inositol polyphosphate-related phosphatase domain-containing protein n=1 Tax=Cotesia typhae TaxID=2053667 RepID=A0A8J5QT54_9HYME|nr:hypothetical protein G9C98_000673 [Cotesia typhae]